MNSCIIKSIRKFSSSFIELENQYGCHNYKPLPLVIAKAKGVHVTDVDGKQYIDFLAAYSAVNQGHVHPKILEKFIEQAQKVTLTSRAFHNDQLGLTEQYLAKLFKYDKVLLMNSGVEAGESAIKFARRWGYNVKKIKENNARVLFAKGNFWGRTIAACASSDDPSRFHQFGPFNGLNFDLIDYNSAEILEETLKNNPNYVAFMVEPIQGENGVIMPQEGYLQKVSEICKRHNVLFIADEIQTGLGRTGKMLCCDWENVKPDIVLLGKALSGGFYPVSAVLANNEVMDLIRPGDHGSTYGGNPLASSLVRVALDVILNENMLQRSLDMGKYLFDGLTSVQNDKLVAKRGGKGLFCAIEFKEDGQKYKDLAWKFCLKAMENGLLAKQTHHTTVRFSPPLVITKEEVDKALAIIWKTIKEIN